MRTKTIVRAGLASGTVLAGVLLAGPPALADDLDVSPSRVPPNGSVTVSGGCQAEDRYVSISGGAQGKGVVNDGWFSVQASVVRSEPGRYTVTAKCITSDYAQDGRFTVRGTRHGAVPHGGAMTGGGGTQGPDLPWTPVGLALAAGAACVGGTALIRSRARGRV
ncbi:hypothetical protein [Actinomadura xylanilytica]|uniref:hypothetical protein n=1 Tax=Actinomadura xylanilytica TaxID=887459 RepID=UPI00255AFABA|nr:hypothetical protein [Actinomadura xylanilytica]MDL4776423.1 hypothetical protein [Actinomadura xylanilytica]